MKKLSLLLLSCLLATGTATAQTVQPKLQKLLPTEQAKQSQTAALKYPALFQRRTITPQTRDVAPATKHIFTGSTGLIHPASKPQKLAKNVLRAPKVTSFLANIGYMGSWTEDNQQMGVYTVTPGPSIGLSKNIALKTAFDFGCGIQNGQLYGIYGDMTFASIGLAIADLYQIDLDTWTVVPQQGGDYLQVPANMLATETAQAPDGTIYGQFVNPANYSNFTYGTVDYAKVTRTFIGSPTTKVMAAMGVTSDNRLYGVCVDGNLYQIDTQTGEEKLVGPTGLKVALNDSTSSYYTQTGEIDPSTNTFYWHYVSPQQQSGLYTVDLATGHATKIGDYPNEKTVMLFGMLFPQPLAPDGAPGRATDITADFSDGSTTGSISFTAPSITYDSLALTGELKYNIFIDGDTLASGTTSAGSKVKATVTAPEGLQTFYITTTNATGTSPKTRVQAWVGEDYPQTVGNLHLDINNETAIATLTWNEPTAGTHNGHLGTITYDVYRDNEGTETLVAKNLDKTIFTDTLTKGVITSYTYYVVAKNGDKRSERAASNIGILGNAYEVPYAEYFKNINGFNEYTNIDANGDKDDSRSITYGAWSWQEVSQDKDGRACYWYSTNNAADDWLITPAIRLRAGQQYRFAVSAASMRDTYPEKFEVKMGKGTTVADMTTAIIPPTTIASNFVFTNYADTLTVPSDGDYNFGIHAISDANMLQLFVDSVTVDPILQSEAPDSVTRINVVPDPTGRLQANVSFRAPVFTKTGKVISGNLDSIEVRRNSEKVYEFKNVAPGTNLSFTDTKNIKNGTNEYVIIPYLKDMMGVTNRKSVYIGVDVPLPVDSLEATDNATNVALTWQPVSNKGANGGVVIPSDVSYTIYDAGQGNALSDELGTTKATNFTVPFNTDEGEQETHYWAVAAKNAAGTSVLPLAPLTVGAPYKIPLQETLAGQKLHYFWNYTHSDDAVYLGWGNESSDGDGYCFYLRSDEGNSNGNYIGSLNTGKINVDGAADPTLLVDVRSTQPNNPMVIAAEKADGSISILYDGRPTAWFQTLKVKLNNFKGERYIKLSFYGEFLQAGIFAIDNIRVIDQPAHDMAIAVSAPKQVRLGEQVPVVVTLSNEGDKATSCHYTLKAGNREVASGDVQRINSVQKLTRNINYKPSAIDGLGNITLTATVTSDEDAADSNNVATTSILVNDNDAESPTNLNANNSDGTVKLTWDAPSTASKVVTDDFESYTPWSTAFGDWTLVDNNKGYAGGFFQSITYPTQGKQFAFTIFNPDEMYEGLSEAVPLLAPHSGEQYVAAPFEGNAEGTATIDADNWLISPLLSGNAQTVTFYVHNNGYSDANGNTINLKEKFDVLYSTTDTQTASFQKIGNTLRADNLSWQKVSVELPEGAKYFAIHQTTDKDSTFLFSIDDITYEQGAGTVQSYNIYMDGELIGTVPGNEIPAFTVNNADGNHTFGVTAVYTNGTESSPATASIATGINEIHISEEAGGKTYNISGQRIGKDYRGVVILNGKKIIRK